MSVHDGDLTVDFKEFARRGRKIQWPNGHGVGAWVVTIQFRLASGYVKTAIEHMATETVSFLIEHGDFQ